MIDPVHATTHFTIVLIKVYINLIYVAVTQLSYEEEKSKIDVLLHFIYWPKG